MRNAKLRDFIVGCTKSVSSNHILHSYSCRRPANLLTLILSVPQSSIFTRPFSGSAAEQFSDDEYECDFETHKVFFRLVPKTALKFAILLIYVGGFYLEWLVNCRHPRWLTLTSGNGNLACYCGTKLTKRLCLEIERIGGTMSRFRTLPQGWGFTGAFSRICF